MKKIFMTVLLVISISILPTACSNYGKLRLQQVGKPGVTPDDLVRNWRSYDVYYSGVASHRVSAVLFDPRGDDKKMAVHPWWVKIDNEMFLLEVMEWITFDMQFEPFVWRIMGPYDGFYGYLYTPWNHALLRVMDEKTLWIDDMSMPPDYQPGDNRVRGAGP